MTQPVPETPHNLTPLEERLRPVLAARSTIANVLHEIENDHVGWQSWRLKRLRYLFNDPRLTAAGIASHPEALAICLPLIQSAQPPVVNDARDTELSRQEIASAVRVGCNRVTLTRPTTMRLVNVFAYPLFIVLMSLGLLVFFSFEVIPVFENMFDDFGLQLPGITNFVILVSHWVRDGWWLVLAVFGTIILALLLSRLNSNLDSSSRYRYGAVEGWLTSARSAWADWAWHVAMLTEAGVAQPDSVAIAGNASSKTWLARCSRVWSEQLRRGDQPFATMTHLDGKPLNTLMFALRLPHPQDQAALLHDVAANYQDWESSRTRWSLSWVTPVTVTVIAFCVGTALSSLFLPLVSLISGLT